jgi:oxaloacetate decarboxylase alpha subunit
MPAYFISNDEQTSDGELADKPASDKQAARCYEVETLADGSYQVVTPDGEKLNIDAYAPIEGRLQMIVDGASFDADVRAKDSEHTVQLRGETHHIDVLNERQKRMRVAGVGARGAGGPDLVSPMAGKIVALSCAEGDDVDEGDCVIIVEAMKMENDLKAHITGTVTTIHVTAGDAVEIGDVLVSIE